MDPTTRGILIGCYCHHPDGIGDGHGTALSFPPWTQYSLDLGPIQTSAERPTLAGGMQQPDDTMDAHNERGVFLGLVA